MSRERGAWWQVPCAVSNGDRQEAAEKTPAITCPCCATLPPWSRLVGMTRRIRPSRPRVPTRAHQTGLRLENVPRPSLAKLRRRHKLDAQDRQALGLILRRRRRPRKAGR